jgi:soluble lytic murein transglycosylase
MKSFHPITVLNVLLVGTSLLAAITAEANPVAEPLPIQLAAVDAKQSAVLNVPNDDVFRVVPAPTREQIEKARAERKAAVQEARRKAQERVVEKDVSGTKIPVHDEADGQPFTEFKTGSQDMPAVLSDGDVELYKELLRLQRDRRHKEVEKLRGSVKDTLLMGHLDAVRLTHPLVLATYPDLRRWLTLYNDQSPASDVYALALKRRPRNAKDELPTPTWVRREPRKKADDDETPRERAVSTQTLRARLALQNRLKSLRVKGQYTQAIKELDKPATRRLLGDENYFRAGFRLAQTMLNGDRDKAALDLAEKLINQTAQPQPDGLWISGLAAYKQRNYEKAASTFRRLVYSVPPRSPHYARGAWWAARAYDRLDRASMGRVFLAMAMQDPYSFYGLLATEKLGEKVDTDWTRPALTEREKQRLLAIPGIRRVVALVQVGERLLAQREMRTIYDSIPYKMDESLLALSIGLDLPGMSHLIARNLNDRDRPYLAGLFAYPREWKPLGGYRLDRALLFAISRQESAFLPAATSRVGAMGLMQVMPATARHIRDMQGKPPLTRDALYRPEISLMLGQDYLDYLKGQFDGNLVHMIAAYNAGPGSVNKWKADEALRNDPILFIESIPFEETRTYVMKVMANLWMYRSHFYGEENTLSTMVKNQWPNALAMTTRKKKTDG